MNSLSARLFLLTILGAALANSEASDPAPLTLEACLRISVEKNPRLLAASQGPHRAEGELKATRSARYPHVALEGGYFRLQSPPEIDVFGQSVTLGRPDNFWIGLGAYQPIWSGGALENEVASAEHNQRSEELRFQIAREDTAFLVHEAFYGVLLARELVTVRRASLDQLGEHLDATRARFGEGVVSEYEVLRAEVEVANHRPLLIAAENQLNDARERLTRLLGLDLSQPVEVSGHLELEPWRGELNHAVEAALSGRYEVKAARAREKSAKAALDAAQSTSKPHISWFAHLFATSPEYFIATDRSLVLNVIGGVTVSLPLYTGHEIEGSVQQSRAHWRMTDALIEDTEQKIALEVREAHRQLVQAEATVQAQARVIEQAERALAIAGVRYENGLGTQLEVTDAQLALSQARVVRLEAIHAHAVARAALRRAQGESLLPKEARP